LYLAEIHGKLSREIERKEDVLTSNVFSFFKYSDRRIFLKRFLELFDCNVSEMEALSAEFYFWPIYDDGTEPDIVIIVGNYYLLFEAKYFSGFGQENQKIKHQLEREYKGGIYESSQFEKQFKLIAITADYYNNLAKYKNIPEDIRDKIIWINWQKITKLLEVIIDENVPISNEVTIFCQDLITLLQKKRLRNYYGFNYLFSKAYKLLETSRIFFDLDTIKYKDIFLGFGSIENLGFINDINNFVFYNGSSFYSFREKFNRIVENTDNLFYRKGDYE